MRKLVTAPASLTDRQQEILTGSMLGDGCIQHSAEKKNGFYRVERVTTDIEYLQWNETEFHDFCNPGYPRSSNHSGGEYTYFITKQIPLFTQLRRIWYPNGKKILPKNLVLTPLTIAVWFFDDGHMSVSTKHKPREINCGFSTHGFTKTEVIRLCEMLNNSIGLGDAKHKFIVAVDDQRDTGHSIYYMLKGGTNAAHALLKTILPVAPPGMPRKTDAWHYIADWTGSQVIAKGEQMPQSKLTEKQVIQIKRLLLQDNSKAAIAKLFGVSASAISLIASGQNWKHVKLY